MSRCSALRSQQRKADLSSYLRPRSSCLQGLTLTCAKYVFLLEPTVAPSFELQAVGRVDRMGQTQETKVFCLFSEHTIDSSIVLLQGPFSSNLRSARYLSDLCLAWSCSL